MLVETKNIELEQYTAISVMIWHLSLIDQSMVGKCRLVAVVYANDNVLRESNLLNVRPDAGKSFLIACYPWLVKLSSRVESLNKPTDGERKTEKSTVTLLIVMVFHEIMNIYNRSRRFEFDVG